MNWIAEGAHWLGVVPLLWLAWLHWRGVKRAIPWWLMATGFAVSFVADFFPHAQGHQVYPVLQAGLFALTLLERGGFTLYVAALVFTASLSIMWRGAGGYDVVLRAVAWGGIAASAWWTLREGLVRHTLAFGFAGMLLAWLWFTLDPTFLAWGTLQAVRLVTTVAWCVAVRRDAGSA